MALQAEYERLKGVNPSSFQDETLPTESVSWLDAVRFCNAKSDEAGLTPADRMESHWAVRSRFRRLRFTGRCEKAWLESQGIHTNSND